MIRALCQRRRETWAAGTILILFLGLAVLYNASVPPFEAPDELQHAAFVTWLADEKRLPVLEPGDPGPWEQEGTQPPLYYGIVAVLVGSVPHRSAGNLAELNPHANIGDPLRPDNKNRVLHDPEQEQWPYQGTALFVHLARLVSTLMAAGSLVGVYCLGRLTFPERKGVALGMMGLVAFVPQFLFVSAAINNDNLVILIGTWVLVLLVGWLQNPALPGWFSLMVLGLLLGAGALAKSSGLLLWPLAVLAMFWLAWKSRNLRWLLLGCLLAFAVAAAVCGWWYVRNWQLYGEISGIGAHLGLMGTRRRFPSRPAAIWAEFKGLRYSFWALFGWFNILLPTLFYQAIDILTILALVGFGLFVARSIRNRTGGVSVSIVMLCVWFALVSLAFVRWTLLTPASQGRLLYPALAPVALILVVGGSELLPRRFSWPLGAAMLMGWATWAGLCPGLAIRPPYALPERVASVDQLAVEPSFLDVRYGGCCELVGYIPSGRPVHAGDRVPVTLVWQSLEATDRDYSLFVHAMAADDQQVGQVDSYPGSGMYPTSLWHSGEIIVDTVSVLISARVKGPILVRFDVGLYDLASGRELAAYSGDGRQVRVVSAGEVAVDPREWPQLPTNPASGTVFEDKIGLAGVELSEPIASPGQAVTLTLTWEALAPITEDYAGFVHLVSPDGRDVAQDDHLPMQGQYPTRLWSADAVILDPYLLQLPADLEQGTYQLWGGLYHPASGQRLQAMSRDTGERWKDDLVLLGILVVSLEGSRG
jgi:hypothetical protein